MARDHNDFWIVRRLMQHATGYRRQLAVLLVVSLLATPIALLAPVPLKIAVDNVIGSKPVPGYLGFLPTSVTSSKNALLVFVVVLVLVIALLTQLQSLTSEALGAYTGEKLKLRFRASLFRHVQRLSLSYHDTRGTTDSLYRIQYDASAIQWVLVQSITPLLSAGLMLVAMLYVTSRISPELAVIGLAVSPILLLLTALSRRVLRRGWRVERDLDSSAMSVVHEVLSGLRVVKSFAQEEREQERFVSRSALGTRARISLAFREGFFGLLIAMTIAAGTGIALYVGVHQVQSGAITLGSLLLVMAYLAALYVPLQTLASGIGTLQASLASAERVFAVLDETPDVEDSPSARPIDRAQGEIELRGVSFEYAPGHSVLHDVSFRIPVGARVGIAGRTGSGKSTLVSLMTRLHDPSTGSVLLDGLDLRSARLADVRSQFAIVLQDTILFSATVAENLSYGRPEAGLEEVVAAAEAAGAHEFIARLPNGYDTVVGERGMTLSGGERQRISLGRAFLKDAPILVLDEPTSAVDTRTEIAMIEAIERLMEGRTVVMIAHRLSTLSNCDFYLELEDGRVNRRTVLAEHAGAP